MLKNPAQVLLLEHFYPQKDARVLALEGGDGWMVAEASKQVPEGIIHCLGRDARQILAARNRLVSIPNASSSFDVFPTETGFNIVLLTIPKERRYARTLLLAAWYALTPGGQLLLAGPTKKGAKAVITDAGRLFGEVNVLGYRSHQRIASCHKGPSLPKPLPKEFQQTGVAPGTTHTIEIHQGERTFTLETHPGVFSWEALDQGTALLLDHLKVNPGERVWDVGCGYGVIGLWCALAGAQVVAMSDINLLAVRYAWKNTGRLGLEDKAFTFLAAGLDPIPEKPASLFSPHPDPLSLAPYDLVVSNPTFHKGHRVETSMADQLIIQAAQVLSPKGRLIIVANRFLNYDKRMRLYFKRVARIAETSHFHILLATNH